MGNLRRSRDAVPSTCSQTLKRRWECPSGIDAFHALIRHIAPAADLNRTSFVIDSDETSITDNATSSNPAIRQFTVTIKDASHFMWPRAMTMTTLRPTAVTTDVSFARQQCEYFSLSTLNPSYSQCSRTTLQIHCCLYTTDCGEASSCCSLSM